MERRAFLTRGGLLAGGAALGAALGATPAAAQVTDIDFIYLPVSPPFRVFDSRQSFGPLYNGDTVTLFTGLNTATPPPLAVTVNLTVTLSHQKGWIALYPGGTTFQGTSSINWFGGLQDLANNAYVEIPPSDGSVELTCGGIPGAQAQFVIDLIGATAPVDLSTTSAAQAFSAYRIPWHVG